MISEIGLLRFLTVFGRIGLLSFGGPAAQIAVMEEALVTKRKWLSAEEFLRALGFCTLLPGPEAMQLVTYAGWRVAGVWGGILAGALFVLPGAVFMLALTLAYLAYGALPLVDAAFQGVQVSVLVIVGLALARLARKVLVNRLQIGIALTAFLLLSGNLLPFPVVIFSAGLLGFFTTRMPALPATPTSSVNWLHTLTTALLWLALWWAPLIALGVLDQSGLLWEIATFFSWLAVVTFGGAYAVLAYMAQAVVDTRGWLTAAQMADGLGLAETTPGPLILVTQFVGTLAGAQAGGWPMALVAAFTTLWATFLPCYLWIFTGGPFVERLTTAPRLQAALTGITAAVLGVIAKLSLWFAFHILFETTVTASFGPASVVLPLLCSVSHSAVLLFAIAVFSMTVLRRGLILTLCLTALASVAFSTLA